MSVAEDAQVPVREAAADEVVEPRPLVVLADDVPQQVLVAVFEDADLAPLAVELQEIDPRPAALAGDLFQRDFWNDARRTILCPLSGALTPCRSVHPHDSAAPRIVAAVEDGGEQ